MVDSNTVYLEHSGKGIHIRGWRGGFDVATEIDGSATYRFWRPGGAPAPSLRVRTDPNGYILEVEVELPPLPQETPNESDHQSS